MSQIFHLFQVKIMKKLLLLMTLQLIRLLFLHLYRLSLESAIWAKMIIQLFGRALRIAEGGSLFANEGVPLSTKGQVNHLAQKSGVYAVVNTKTSGEAYIGSNKKTGERWRKHRGIKVNFNRDIKNIFCIV